ncbi:MAG: hypothetical protein JST40_08585 [Armatimonadetes bacterium]|nr:hypothetical protein [Armatimonadota bacterium]
MKRGLGICILALFVATISGAQSDGTYGKSDAEILAMGEDHWYHFFTERAGESTASMSEAYQLFGGALQRRNDKLLAKQKKELRKKLETLKVHLRKFSSAVLEMGYGVTGGGTIWIPVSARAMDVVPEAHLYEILTGKYGKRKGWVVSQVTKPLNELDSRVQSLKNEEAFGKEYYPRANDSSKVAKSELQWLISYARTTPRKTSDCILECCFESLKTALEMSSGE